MHTTIEGELDNANSELAARDQLIDEQQAEIEALKAELAALKAPPARMTYAQLFGAVAALVPNLTFAIEVESWRWAFGDRGERHEVESKWMVFLGAPRATRVEAPTAEEVLSKASLAVQQFADATDQTGIGELIGDASVSMPPPKAPTEALRPFTADDF